MIIQRKFTGSDMYAIDSTIYLSEYAKTEVRYSTNSWTIVSGSKVVCIWGAVSSWDSRAVLWGIMAHGSKHCMKQIFQFAKSTIDAMTETRLELQVLCGFGPGIRFAEMLGFNLECVMRKYSQGKDALLYARIQ